MSKPPSNPNTDVNAAEAWVKLFEGQFFKTRICSFWKKGACRRGRHCKYAHGEREMNAPPDLTNTSICKQMLAYGHCKDDGCPYAHATSELRSTKTFYKTTMCTFHKVGKCKLGTLCRHAHTEDELYTNQVEPTAGQQLGSANPKRQANPQKPRSRMMTQEPCIGVQHSHDVSNLEDSEEDLGFEASSSWGRMQTTPASVNMTGNRKYPVLPEAWQTSYLASMSMDLPQYPASSSMDLDGQYPTRLSSSGNQAASKGMDNDMLEYLRQEDEADLEAEAINEVKSNFVRRQTMPASMNFALQQQRPHPQAAASVGSAHIGASATTGCLPSMDLRWVPQPMMQSLPDINGRATRSPCEMSGQQCRTPSVWTSGGGTAEQTRQLPLPLPQQLPQLQQQQQSLQHVPQNGFRFQAAGYRKSYHDGAAATSGCLPPMEHGWVVNIPTNGANERVQVSNLEDSEDNLGFEVSNNWGRMQTTPASVNMTGNREYPALPKAWQTSYLASMSMDLPQYPASSSMDLDGQYPTRLSSSVNQAAGKGMDSDRSEYLGQQEDEADLEAEAMNEVKSNFVRRQTMPATMNFALQQQRPHPQADACVGASHVGASATTGCLPSMDLCWVPQPMMQSVPDINGRATGPPCEMSGQQCRMPGVWTSGGGTAEQTQQLPLPLPQQLSQLRQQQQQQQQQFQWQQSLQHMPQNGFRFQAAGNRKTYHDGAAATSGCLPSMEHCGVVGSPTNGANERVQVTPARLLTFLLPDRPGNHERWDCQQQPSQQELASLDEFEDDVPWQRAQTLPASFPAATLQHTYHAHKFSTNTSSTRGGSGLSTPSSTQGQSPMVNSEAAATAVASMPHGVMPLPGSQLVLAPGTAIQVPGGILVCAGYAPATGPNESAMASGHEETMKCPLESGVS